MLILGASLLEIVGDSNIVLYALQARIGLCNKIDVFRWRKLRFNSLFQQGLKDLQSLLSDHRLRTVRLPQLPICLC